jgi:prepilin-type N-terminal cleavage/methylation domain-containing protein/prepilin-type processing-associated H-X9-DG protein
MLHAIHPASRRAAFTLVELLVVISIIALLISMILPSLSQSRDLARNLRCKANLRQLATANASYAAEFKGYAPLVNSTDNAYAGWTWMFLLSTYLNGPDKSQMMTIYASPASGSNWVKAPHAMMKVMQCPSTWRAFEMWGYASYAINVNLTNETTPATFVAYPCRLDSPQMAMRHHEVVLFGESIAYNQILPAWNGVVLYDHLHQKRRNYAMADGHVVDTIAQNGSYLMGYYKAGSPYFAATIYGRNNNAGAGAVGIND